MGEDPSRFVHMFEQSAVLFRPSKVEPRHLEVSVKLGAVPPARAAEAVEQGGAGIVLEQELFDAFGETVGHLIPGES